MHDERFGEGRTHSQLRQVAAVLRHDGIALRVDRHAEVGHHRRRTGATAFGEHTAGTRIQVPDFAAHAFHVLVAQVHAFGDAVPARVDEVVVEAIDHLTGLARSRQLQEQAVAQVARTDAAGLKLLHQPRQPRHFLGRGVDILVEGQLVGQRGIVFREKSALVERAHEIDHDGAFVVGEIEFADLSIQIVVGGFVGANLPFAPIVFAAVGVSLAQVVGHVVECAIVAHGVVERIAGFVVFSVGVRIVPAVVALVVAHFERLVVEQLVLQAGFEIGQRHLDERGEEHLRARGVLHLLLLLLLSETLALGHDRVWFYGRAHAKRSRFFPVLR